jgi:hypothetical protein
MDGLLLEHYENNFRADNFDSDNEMLVEIINNDTTNNEHVYLSLNQVNELINYLVSQLQSVGEPVEALNVAK